MLFALGSMALLAAQQVSAAPTAEARSDSIPVSEKTLKLKTVGHKPRSSREILSGFAATSTSLKAVEEGGSYAVEVSLGGTDYDLIFDTGSSDLWVFKRGVECFNAKGRRAAASECGFGPEFNSTYEGGKIAEENFYIEYADDEQLIGTLGYEDVTIAGVTVKKQEISLVTEAYWDGDGVVSGIVGFASKYITNSYPGTDAANDNSSDVINYNNFLTNAINNGEKSLFTVVIERDGGASSVTVGGVPSKYSSLTYTSTPREKIAISDVSVEKTEYTYYTITPGGYELGGVSETTSYAGIVDTGTTLLYLPDKYAEAVNAAYDPPSQYIEEEGVYENDCNATPPKFGITIGGTTFYINSDDLLLTGKLGEDSSTGGCVTGVQPSGADYAILGDIFLKNVVAVFDVGAETLKFAPHETY